MLDVSDLLQDYDKGEGDDITDFISVEDTGDDVVVTLSPNGDDGESQIIKLENQSFTDLGVTDPNDAVNQLIDSGAIKVDES